MLTALKKRLAPTDRARKLELARAYEKLKRYNKDQPYDQWLKDWETTYTQADKLKVPAIVDAVYHFVAAVSEFDPAWSASQKVYIKVHEKLNEPYSIYDVIEEFRNHQRENQASAFYTSHSGAFVTFKGRDQDGKKQQPRNCVCGSDKHSRWEKCWYINAEVRPKVWKPDEAIFKKINDWLNRPDKKGLKAMFLNKWKYDANLNPSQHMESTKQTTKDYGSLATALSTSTSTIGSTYKLYNCWTVDGGADVHICNDASKHDFTKTRDPTEPEVIYAGKAAYPVEAYGNVKLYFDTPEGRGLVTLTNVALTPGYVTNIIATDIIAEKGVYWSTEHPEKLTRKGGSTFCYLYRRGRHFTLEKDHGDSKGNNLQLPELGTLATKKSENQQRAIFTEREMHHILGHPGPKAISHLQDSVNDITIDYSDPAPSTIDCESCSLSKATQIISRQLELEHKTDVKPFEYISWDLIQMDTAYNGDQYISHYCCRKFGFHMVYTLKTKSEASRNFEEALRKMETLFGAVTKHIRLDGETSLGHEFSNLAIQKGFSIDKSAPDTQAQNGNAERAGRTILTKARALRIEAKLPSNLWPEAVKTAGYLANRTPTQRLNWRTPFEAITKEKPKMSRMHPFGCKAYALLKGIPKKKKLDPRAHIGYFMGYDSTNIYRIWIPTKQKVIRSRDVTFDHRSYYNPQDIDVGFLLKETADTLVDIIGLPEFDFDEDENNEPETGQTTDPNEEEIYDTIVVQVPSNPTRSANPMDSTEQTEPTDNLQLLSPSPTPGPTMGTVPQSSSRVRRKAAHVTMLQQVQTLSSYHAAFTTGLIARKHKNNLPPEPVTWRDMLKHPEKEGFIQAAKKEYGDLLLRETFSRLEHITEKLLPLKWIFKYKFDCDGFLLKHKARLCARGDLQTTEEETYAATLAIQVFRAIMSLIAAFELKTNQYDAINAFINSFLTTPVPCQYPEGFEEKGTYLLAQRALYGFKESPYLWYKDFSGSMEHLGLSQVPGVNCLYTNNWLILIFFVDDIITAYHPDDQVKYDIFEAKLTQQYELRSLGEAKQFINIRIVRDKVQKKLWLVQDSYVDGLCAKFKVDTTSKTPKTPLPTTPLLPFEGTATEEQIYAYQQRVGSINYPAIITRPDIARAASKLSEFLQNPSPDHLQSANQCLRYIVGTKNYAIEYDGNLENSEIFLTWSDAAFADDPKNRYSSNGFCIKLFGGVIHYKATKQKTVTTSSTEAELLALSFTAKEMIWWKRLFAAIHFDMNKNSNIYCDNAQTIRLMNIETPRLSTKLKHVDIHQCWLRQEVQAKQIGLEYTRSSEMVADGLTKELSPQKHATFVKQLGLVDITTILTGNNI
jgi:hypothetical protein